MEVMCASEAQRPQLRRLGDRLGAIYTPVALVAASLAWAMSGEAVRFLAVLVIATPCPLLIAIPIAIIGSISLCARRSIIVKSPVALERIGECRTAIFDKTGTLTYGEPTLTELLVVPGLSAKDVLTLVAGLEQYSKHPLARAILAAAKADHLSPPDAAEVSEQPGEGLRGKVSGRRVQITSRGRLADQALAGSDQLPPVAGGLECVVALDERYAAILRFRDAPRAESLSFVAHLRPKHQFERLMIVSGDRETEVRYLAAQVGITEIHAAMSPEEKLAVVRHETAAAKTLYVGDGINDAPAMMAATVGIAIGRNSDVAAEAASVVLMDNSLKRVDEFIHISRRMRAIAPERGRWHGAESGRHGRCRYGSLDPSGRGDQPGSHRRSGGTQCAASRLPAQGARRPVRHTTTRAGRLAGTFAARQFAPTASGRVKPHSGSV
jgi:P-type E1-E2 ATPase